MQWTAQCTSSLNFRSVAERALLVATASDRRIGSNTDVSPQEGHSRRSLLARQLQARPCQRHHQSAAILSDGVFMHVEPILIFMLWHTSRKDNSLVVQ